MFMIPMRSSDSSVMILRPLSRVVLRHAGASSYVVADGEITVRRVLFIRCLADCVLAQSLGSHQDILRIMLVREIDGCDIHVDRYLDALNNDIQCLLEISRNAEVSKTVSANYDAEMLAGMGEAFPPGLTNLFMRTLAPSIASAMTPGNVLVSNVRGTPVPLYVAGARIETMYPLSLLMPSQGLNITVVSYMGKVDVGFVADPDLVDDVGSLADGVSRALAELVEAVEKEKATPGVEAADAVA